MNNTRFKNSPGHWLILIGVLIVSFIAGGYWYDQHQFKIVRDAEYKELKAVARLKINQLAEWRGDAIFNVGIYAQSRLFSDAVARLLKQPRNPSLKEKILEGWNLIRINDGYSNVILTGLDGRIKLALEPARAQLTVYEQNLVKKTAETSQAVFSDLFRCLSAGAIRLDVMAPVKDSSRHTIAVLILRIDPEKDLYPLLDFWPTASESSETYIVRQENEQFVLMNRLRTEPQRELIKLLPLSPSTVEGFKNSIKSGGIFEGKDSRGIEVVAYISRVPETPWFMVTQVDKKEVLAFARYQAHFIAIIVFLLIMITVIGSGFIYRHQRARLYRELLESERIRNELLEEFRITLYSIGDGVISMDENGRIRHMNPVAERLTGWSEAEAVNKPLSEVFHIIHEKTRKKVESPDKRVLQKRGIVKLPADTILIARDGSEHPIADSAAPINKEKEKLSGIVVVFSDVTAERKAQRDLRISEERYRSFFTEDITADFISLPDGTLLECNPAFARIFGFKSKKEAKKHNLLEFYATQQDREILMELLHKDRKVYNHEQQMVRIDGRFINVIENVIGKFDAQGRLMQIQGYIFDITERKKLEKQFLQAQKMEAIGRLAGGVAHDFNNMLSVILGYSEILLSRDVQPDTDICRKITEIKKAAQRSADLTRQLLAFARKQIIEPKVLNINDSVTGMLKILRRLIGEDIDLIWNPGKDIWNVKMDPSQVDQLLANLVINARDAIEGVGKVTIETSTAVFDREYCNTHLGFIPGEYVMLAVSDDGCGMDKETLSHIYEPFFTTKEKGKGTGLGLSTIYGIVKQNGGFINVYSEPEKGTTFKIYLKRFSGKETTSGKELPPEKIWHGTETIILVEDEKQILAMAMQILESLGYNVLTANTPDEAVKMVQEYSGEIDLLITDVILPSMSCLDLVKQIRTLKPQIKYLYMSGYTANAIVHRGVLQEGVNFLQKPFSIKDIATKVREVLDA